VEGRNSRGEGGKFGENRVSPWRTPEGTAVRLRRGAQSLNELDDNEEDLLDRAWGTDGAAFLSLQEARELKEKTKKVRELRAFFLFAFVSLPGLSGCNHRLF
jgi:hypothetical protein